MRHMYVLTILFDARQQCELTGYTMANRSIDQLYHRSGTA